MTDYYQNVLSLIKDGNLQKAHALVQQNTDKMSCLMHAYIHRALGDLGNANHWYQKAGIKAPDITLTQEYERLIKKLEVYGK